MPDALDALDVLDAWIDRCMNRDGCVSDEAQVEGGRWREM
jgi:hypothetical protein